MKTFDCSQCGRPAKVHVWGFTLLAKEGWGIASATEPPGAAERAWLCPECAVRQAQAERALAKQIGPKSIRDRGRRGRPLRVLLIDDHVLLLRCMARLLTTCETAISTNPQQALSMLLDGAHFDAIVCDVMMPEISGPELFARCYLHARELGRRFLFVSSDPVAGRRALTDVARRVGASYVPPVLQKPISQASFVEAVNSVAAAAAQGSGTYELNLTESAQRDTQRPKQRSSSGFR